MNSWQRRILDELRSCCERAGITLDSTAAAKNIKKLIERQESHKLSVDVLYAVLCDTSENEFREEDRQSAEHALAKFKELVEKWKL